MRSVAKIIPASDIQFSAKLAPVKESLQKARAIVLMDLDGTVIDENYAVTNLRGLKRAIALLQEANILVGLHSDTPRTSLLQFAGMYSIRGPLIYEMAGIHLPDFDLDIILDPFVKEYFTRLRDKLYEAALAFFVDSRDLRYLITKDRDKNKEKREGKVYPGYQRGLFINRFREYSLGYWTEGFNNQGIPFVDTVFHQQVNRLVSELLDNPSIPPREKLFLYQNPNDGTSVIRPAHLHTKLSPIQALLAIGEYQGPVYMLGNTAADFIFDTRVITLGVGNADQALRDLIQNNAKVLSDGIQRITQGTYVDGVIEHLHAILQSLKAQ